MYFICYDSSFFQRNLNSFASIINFWKIIPYSASKATESSNRKVKRQNEQIPQIRKLPIALKNPLKKLFIWILNPEIKLALVLIGFWHHCTHKYGFELYKYIIMTIQFTSNWYFSFDIFHVFFSLLLLLLLYEVEVKSTNHYAHIVDLNPLMVFNKKFCFFSHFFISNFLIKD